MAKTTYVFPQIVTRIYEKELIKSVRIRDKGKPSECTDIAVEKLGWVIVIGSVGYVVPDKPDFDIGQEVEVVIRPVDHGSELTSVHAEAQE